EKDSGAWRKKVKIAPDTGKRVAIVGSGPAGLTAAWFLRKSGHTVTVFEAMPEAGGMMRSTIPRYRLPADILDKEIADIMKIGVEIKINAKIGSTDELFDQGSDAIFLALGASHGMKMGIPGEEDPRVLDGISVLEAINFGREIDLSGKIAVVGGGNVAIDVARSALRIGAEKVTMLYRRSRSEMPAAPEEIEEALEEGVVIDFLTTPVAVRTEKNKLILESIRMELGDADSSGRRRPVPIEGSEFIVEADSLVMAIGQRPDVPAGLNVSTDKKGRIIADPETLAASREGVFAGGDVVTGPDSIISAIQAGRVAADSIEKCLGGAGRIDQRIVPLEEIDVCFGREEGFADRERVKIPVRPVKKRINDFLQVEKSFDEEAATREASRCLRCQARLEISAAPLPPEKP
ncbi:MAG: FAD-dependent oxidoreductase, partial [Candidatus Omnitrophica bacterium]|nr:FAD-dependent oxidoreductase [Candidatus Omnitrophota bacterium]